MKRVEGREGSRGETNAPRELRDEGVVLAHYRQQCPAGGSSVTARMERRGGGERGGRVRAAW